MGWENILKGVVEDTRTRAHTKNDKPTRRDDPYERRLRDIRNRFTGDHMTHGGHDDDAGRPK